MLWTERKLTKHNFWWGFKLYEQFCMSYCLKMLIKSKNLCFGKTCMFTLLKNLRLFWKNLQVKQAIEKPVPTLIAMFEIKIFTANFLIIYLYYYVRRQLFRSLLV
jgi:hypothetical protein